MFKFVIKYKEKYAKNAHHVVQSKITWINGDEDFPAQVTEAWAAIVSKVAAKRAEAVFVSLEICVTTDWQPEKVPSPVG